jgi:hypothetical protein
MPLYFKDDATAELVERLANDRGLTGRMSVGSSMNQNQALERRGWVALCLSACEPRRAEQDIRSRPDWVCPLAAFERRFETKWLAGGKNLSARRRGSPRRRDA